MPVLVVPFVSAFAAQPVPLSVAEEALAALAAASGARVVSCPDPGVGSLPEGLVPVGDRVLFLADAPEGVVLVGWAGRRVEDWVLLRWSEGGCAVAAAEPVRFRARAERGEVSTVVTEHGACSQRPAEDGWIEVFAAAGVPCLLAAGAPDLRSAARFGELEVRSPEAGAEVVVPVQPPAPTDGPAAVWSGALATPGLSPAASAWLWALRADPAFAPDPVPWRTVPPAAR